MKSKFYIGQKIIAIKDHIHGVFKKNDEFQVLDVKIFCCYIGLKIKNNNITHMLCYCKKSIPVKGGYYNQKSFAPIQEIGDFTFEDAISFSIQHNKELEQQFKTH